MNLRSFTLLIALLASTAGASGCFVDSGDDPDPSSEAAAPLPDDAQRLIFWTACDRVIALSDEELEEWKQRGVDGFVCMTGRLRALGGENDFTGDPDATLEEPGYALQRRLRDTRIAGRAAELGMKMYLGVYESNYDNTATPLAEWFDDGAWSDAVLPSFREFAAAARALGFAGVALDQEPYPQAGGVDTATWDWAYPGNVHSEEEVRAQARERGAQLMGAILEGFPQAEIAVYHFWFPGDWRELVYDTVNQQPATSTKTVHVDFWDGMTSVEGYTAIRFWDNIFYKSPHLGTWNNALTYDLNRVMATLSTRWSNWDHASERVFVSPFSWIDPGPNPDSTFDDARSPEYVANQLRAFRKWSMGGELANYAYGSLDFDYTPYVAALQAASAEEDEDREPPSIRVRGTGGEAIAGTARDNLAIRAVRWEDDEGGSGAAAMQWHVRRGDFDSGYDWEMRWQVPHADLNDDASEVTIVAEDIDGNASKPIVQALG